MIMNERLRGLALRCRREFWKLPGFWSRVISHRKLMTLIFWSSPSTSGVISTKHVLFSLSYPKDAACLRGTKYLSTVAHAVMLCEESACENTRALHPPR